MATSAKKDPSAARNAQDDDKAPVAPPCAMVIFGASGDLTKRLLVPALYNLAVAKRLPDEFQLVGVARSQETSESWASSLTDMINEFVAHGGGEFEANRIDQAVWRWLTDRMSYVPGDLGDPGLYRRLGAHLAELDKTAGTAGNRLFYLAVADRFFGSTVSALGAAGLVTENGRRQWRRVVIEKPFGHDLASAKALNAEILKTLRERQIYRIDHFLGKETVQNIMALRFANGLFEPIWNREHIDHIQITATETVGVEARGNFYDKTGALRDMVPNHMFQLMAITAMEPPISFDADAVRAKKAEVIEAIRPLKSSALMKSAVRGQYDAGTVLGKPVQAYRREPDVDPSSSTETYFACKLKVDNWRWAGVPFYLRTGKHLQRRRTEIAIRFHQAPYALFRGTRVQRMNPNWMILR
ncbi:MAG TPA: glucose-6-phosphate dehydrogenase, partial [Stellaceae bacterium]|nr:glucose-6-phosphate dehydrogenase [Stellaceae bacterium]